MNPLPLRTDGYPHYTVDVTLDGVEFQLEFLWNVVGSYWTITIFAATGERLLSGRRVAVSTPLLARFKDERLPAGEILPFDTSGAGLDPTLEDFGNRVVLLYLTAAEVAAL